MTFGVEENDFKSNIDTLLKNVDAKLYMGKEQGKRPGDLLNSPGLLSN